MLLRGVFLIVGFTFIHAVVNSHCAVAQQIDGLVTVKSGQLPIILSAPHGGREAIPGVPEREGVGVRQFRNKADFNTDQLAGKLADAIEKKLGKRPYTVVARFHRKYVDANRSPQNAYESEQAQSTYDVYHRALAKTRSEVMERWGRGLLLDIHGQAAKPNAIFRGTQNGETTTHLIDRFGRESLTGQTSLFGQLATQGFSVIPKTGSREREHDSYDGGYIVVTYGSGRGGTVDAIQLELGRELRSSQALPKTVSRLANAIAAFSDEYLPHAERKTGPVQRQAALFSDEFSDGKRDGWFELDRGSSSLSVITDSPQLGTAPELTFGSTEKSALKSFATHIPPVRLKRAGDFVTLQFDARHNTPEFVDRGFRFGLFDSAKTQFARDDDLSKAPDSVDDSGFFAVLDLGSSTTNESAAIRETKNSKDARLWDGSTIASADNDKGRDPLMFTRNRSFTYSLTLKRTGDGHLAVTLKNNVSGDEASLTGTSKRPATFTFDTLYFGTYGSTASFAIDNVSVTNTRPGSPKDAIRVGVYVDDGAGPSVKDLLFTLGKFEGVSTSRLTAEQIRSGALADLDLLIHPGGSGGGQGRHLEEGGRETIRNFVKGGGGFIGICAGSYLASADYSWSLNILDAKVVDRKHWARGTGTVEIKVSDSGRRLLKSDRRMKIYYGQGPLLAPGNHPDIADYEAVASFETEIAKNGAPRGVMKGTTAIARGQYGRGSVLCFSPHPELTHGLEGLLKHAINHVKHDRSKTPSSALSKPERDD